MSPRHLVIYLALFTLLVYNAGCGLLGPANSAQGERLLKLLAGAVEVADNVCAQVAEEQHDVKLADTCAALYDGERAGLLAAAAAIDAGNEGDAICAALDVGKGLKAIDDALVARGVQPPKLVQQALSMLDALAPLCPVP